MILFLLFLVAAVAWLVVWLGANTGFGAVQISDGYASPVTLLPNSLEIYQFFQGGGQAVGTEKQGVLIPVAGTITNIRAYLSTVPTGSSFIVDVMKNGVTLFTTSANRPTIAISANASSQTLPDIVAVAAGDQLRVDVIQVGSTIAGSNLYVTVTVKQANVA